MNSYSEEEIDSLNKLAWQYRNKDVFTFKNYGQEAFKASQTLDYLFGICESLQILGTYNFLIGNLDSAIIFYDKALQSRIEFGDSSMISGTLNNMANVYKRKGQYSKALDQYYIAEGYISDPDTLRKARLYINICDVYTKAGNYFEALSYINQAAQILSKPPSDSLTYAICQLNEANIYDLMGDFETALKLYVEASAIFDKFKDILNSAKIDNNIGNIYLKRGEIDLALVKYQDALNKYEVLNSVSGIAGTEQNLGLVFKLKGDFQKSRRYFSSSIEKWFRLKNKHKQSESLVNLGDMYLSQGSYLKAKQTYLDAESLLPTNSLLLSKLYSGLSLSYEKLGQYKTAYPYQAKHISIRDSIETERIKWQNLNSQFKDNQNRILLLEKERDITLARNEKEKISKYFFIISSFLLSTLLFILYLYGKGKRKQLVAEKTALEKQREIEKLLKDQELTSIRSMLDIQDKERKRIAQDLHDELGSTLSMVKLHFQKTNQNIETLRSHNQLEYEKANKLLDEACNQVRHIAHNLSSGILKNFGLVAAIEELKSTLINTGKYDVEFITYQLGERLPYKHEIIIYRIIQELISNILRHAKADEISIQFLRKNDNLHISVEDNGIGFNTQDKFVRSGMGFKNIKARLAGVNGSLTIDSIIGRGTLIFVEIPLNKDI